METNSKFDEIIKDLCSKFNKNSNIIHISFKKFKSFLNLNYLNIVVSFKKESQLNPLYSNLVFIISIYENNLPIVRCMNDFCIPTLFDHRNLLLSIVQHNWLEDSKIEEIIEKIPSFINRVIENTNNRILVYYGDYKIDMIYDVNEILINGYVDFYKVKEIKILKSKSIEKNEYVILTDIYFLLLDPLDNNKNLAKLLFWGDIRQIKSCKGNSTNSQLIQLEWKSENSLPVGFKLIFEDLADFVEQSSKKILKLKENYDVFEDDPFKPNQDSKSFVNSLDKLQLLIQYKEQLLDQKYSINIIKELMSLYQKVIEIMSAKNDPDFDIYLQKLHKLLLDENIQKEIENDTNPTFIQKAFETSSSLYLFSKDDIE